MHYRYLQNSIDVDLVAGSFLDPVVQSYPHPLWEVAWLMLVAVGWWPIVGSLLFTALQAYGDALRIQRPVSACQAP